jgi:3-ketosteroid 9alpha-monooxygenase subunit A
MSERFPFPIPRGWFAVAYTDEIDPGEVRALKYFGKDLVMFRSESGALSVLDAFCPHLGAHLGHGGKVCDGSIVCPFHAWAFRGDGSCAEIPYAKKIPKNARTKAWPLVETAGMVMVWYDPEDSEPAWELPIFTEVEDDGWSDFTRRRWTIRTCNQEMGENAIDSAHFRYLHGTMNQPETSAEIREHVFHAVSSTMMSTPAGPVEGNIEVDCFGFGLSATRFRGLVETLLLCSPTPIDADHCDVRFNFSLKKFGGRSLTRGVGKAFVAEITRQLEQDIPVWENKVYLDRPVLCDGDGPIGLYRRWVKQFYPPEYRSRRASAK